jgi:hypothetical protein
MILQRQISAVLAAILSLFAVTGHARSAQPVSPEVWFSIGADRVAAALAAREIPVQPGQVEFLASVRSKRPEPPLEIERLQTASRDSVLARIHCRNAGECLPFYVVLHLSGEQDAQAMIGRIHPTASPVRAASNPVRPQWVVRTGQTATIVLQGENLRATTPVICLQNGRQGESIRVSSLDRKRIMVGEIIGPGLLRGAL